MKKSRIFAIILIVLCAVYASYFVLSSDKALVAQPKGLVAHKQLELIITNILLMLVIIVPTYFILFFTVWKYRESNTKADYEPNRQPKTFHTALLWLLPSIIVAIMGIITWKATHELDPFKPLKSDVKPVTIQVVAMDWKWLFIYPDHGIATLNFFQFPEQTPINLALSADGSPMNSFWLPQLSGQIYAMTGMTTRLHIMADGPGEYHGRAAEINGEGLADMTFVAKSCSSKDFETWVAEAKKSPIQLTDDIYNELVKRSINSSIIFYSQVEQELFDKIVMRNMHSNQAVS